MLENVFLQYFSGIRLKIDKFNLLISTVGIILLLVSFLVDIVINCNLKGIYSITFSLDLSILRLFKSFI